MTTGEWIQVAAVAVLGLTLGAVLWYAYEARKQAKASSKMVEEMREQRLAERMPLILIDLLDFNTGGMKPGDGQLLDECYPDKVKFRIRNLGSGPAIDVGMTVIHPKAHYWRNATRGYLLQDESIEYETSPSIYQPSGLGLSDCLRKCDIDAECDSTVGLMVRYRDIYERGWLAWMALGYETDLGGEGGDEVIWWLNDEGQHTSNLTVAASDRADGILFGRGKIVVQES